MVTCVRAWLKSRTGTILAVAIGCAALGLGFYRFAYTPTIAIHVVNDSPATVTVAVCGSDAQTAAPGRTVNVDPNPNNPKAACAILVEGQQAAACLYIPTTRFRDGDTVRVSSAVAHVPEKECGL